jgi:enoyl-CoA hydratase/carnithine racemase
MNALNSAIQDRLRELADEVTRREDVRAVVLWGGQQVFAAGADIKEMQAMDHAAMVARSRGLQDSFTAVARIPKPVVAAVTAMRSAAAASWHCAPTSGSPPRTPASASRRSCWG